MTTIGHNSGRVLEGGTAWRTHVWTRARKELLPTLPVEVVRTRVKRAKALGLPYKTYAGVRASCGHDLVGFLFSSNALRVLRSGDDIPQDRAAKIITINAKTLGLAHAPVDPLALVPPLQRAIVAPSLTDSWSDTRDTLKAAIRASGSAPDRYLLVGDTALEREWAEAAQTAGYLTADLYFT